MRYVLLYITILLLPVAGLSARPDTNPLLEMIGKEYSDYFDRYEALNDSLFFGDSLAHARYRHFLTEAAAADPTGEWELNRRLTECQLRFHESCKGGYIPYGDYTAEELTEDLLAVVRDAQKQGFPFVRLRAQFKAADACRIFLHEYDQAFAYYLEVAAGLDTLSQRDFPWKLYMYREIADFYASFREYTDAARFYRRIVVDPDATYKNNHRLYPALSGLGMCYRFAGEYEKSDSCFQRILDLAAPIEADRYVWEGIAGGNIGTNWLLRGDTNRALAWMEPALRKMKRPNDHPFTSSLAANIADVYLELNDLRNGKKYLDLSLRYHRLTRLPKKSSRLLEVEARYRALQGDGREAAALLDSALRAKEREQEAYSGLVLRRVEQQLRAADRLAHERELDTEKLRSTFYKRTAIWVAGALALILLLLALLAIYYRRTRQAYHELVLRSQEWANVNVPKANTADANGPNVDATAVNVPNANVPEEEPHGKESHGEEPHAEAPVAAVSDPRPAPDSADRTIMEKIEQLMNEKKLYTQADLSLDMLALELGLDRRHVSSAVNACAGKNLNAYLNEYRVKEAIRIMSDTQKKNLTIDAIAFDAGFNDRKTFHRIFKQFTGLTPGAFRESL